MMNRAEFVNIAAAESEHWWYRGMRGILFRILDRHVAGLRPARVVEAGCGTGHTAALLEQKYGWRITPADIEWEGLARARAAGLRRLVQADVTHLPFADSSCDVLLSLDVFIHLQPGEERDAMRESARVLRPGGRLVLRAAAFDALRSRHSIFIDEHQRFTRRRLTELAVRHGLRIVRVTYCNSLLLPAAWFLFRIWEPLTRKAPASGVALPPKWLNALLELPLRAESAWLGTGLNLPVGQSLVLVAEKPPNGCQSRATCASDPDSVRDPLA
jgi:SAM-dependent methyltransferase